MKKSYSEKLEEFKKLGPFIFVDTVQYHVGDEEFKPKCAACGSNHGYWFMIIKDHNGKKHFISTNCRRHIKIQFHPKGGEHHGNS